MLVVVIDNYCGDLLGRFMLIVWASVCVMCNVCYIIFDLLSIQVTMVFIFLPIFSLARLIDTVLDR